MKIIICIKLRITMGIVVVFNNKKKTNLKIYTTLNRCLLKSYNHNCRKYTLDLSSDLSKS